MSHDHEPFDLEAIQAISDEIQHVLLKNDNPAWPKYKIQAGAGYGPRTTARLAVTVLALGVAKTLAARAGMLLSGAITQEEFLGGK